MTGLRFLQHTDVTMTINGQEQRFRPLNTEDLEFIFRKNPGDVASLFKDFTAGSLGLEGVKNAVSRYPLIAAFIIGLASEFDLDASEADVIANVQAARRLALPYQVEAIELIARETFSNEGGLASFLEAATRAFNSVSLVALELQGAAPLINENTLNQPGTGSGTYEEI